MRKILAAIISSFLLSSCMNAQEKKVYKDDYIVKTGDPAPDFMIPEIQKGHWHYLPSGP